MASAAASVVRSSAETAPLIRSPRVTRDEAEASGAGGHLTRRWLHPWAPTTWLVACVVVLTAAQSKGVFTSGWARGGGGGEKVLYALGNSEGFNAQLKHVSFLAAVAARTGRTLVMLPSRSYWFVDGRDGDVETPLFLDEVIAETRGGGGGDEGEWRMVRPGKDDLSIFKNYRANCVHGHTLISSEKARGVCHFSHFAVPISIKDTPRKDLASQSPWSTKNGEPREWGPGYYLGLTTFGMLDGDNETFCNPQMKGADNKVVNTVESMAAKVQELNGDNRHACIITRGDWNGALFMETFEWSPKLVALAQRAVHAMLRSSRDWRGRVRAGKAHEVRRESAGFEDGTRETDSVAETVLPLRVVHLRRTDRCALSISVYTAGMPFQSTRAYSADPREATNDLPRCGPVDQLPIIDMCRGVGQWSGKRKLPTYVATEETDPSALNALSDAGCHLYRDLDPDGKIDFQVALAMDYMLMEMAREAYTMGCGSWDVTAEHRRRVRGLSPVMTWVNDGQRLGGGVWSDGGVAQHQSPALCVPEKRPDLQPPPPPAERKGKHSRKSLHSWIMEQAENIKTVHL